MKCPITIKFRTHKKFENHKPQVAQAHYESSEQHYPTELINYSYGRRCMRIIKFLDN